jgi:hypothetical protein
VFQAPGRDRAGWAVQGCACMMGLFTGCDGFAVKVWGVLVPSLVLYVLDIALVVGADQPA